MPQTEATLAPLGSPLPEFRLPDAAGRLVGPADRPEAGAILIAFLSNRCPYVLGIREALRDFARVHAPRGLRVIAVNSNDDDAYPEEGAERTALEAAYYGFPVLRDESQDVARLFGAACTPDLFLYDGDRRLAYHGQFDGFRPKNGVAPSGEDLGRALDAVLAGEPPLARQVLPVGCNIKWREAASVAAA